MKSIREQLRELLEAVSRTEPREIDCEEFLARVGALLEALEKSESPPPELELVSQHLQVCPECREEFDVLVQLHEKPT